VVQISNGILATHSALNFQNPKCLWINFSTVALLTYPLQWLIGKKKKKARTHACARAHTHTHTHTK
jgi:hypothetical protein